VRRLMSLVLARIGLPLTPERVKSETTERLEQQARRLRDLARDERIRDDYRAQDQRLAGRR
jgi:hypothetical protein